MPYTMKSMMRAKRISRQSMIVSALVVVLVAVIAVLGWKYYELKKSPDSSAKAEVANVVKKVSNLYEVPTDEEPTVAKVQNKRQLPKQDFYKNAQDGDYVLVYANNKLAMIYREKTDKLVNVGPVNFANQTGKPTVALMNGAGDSGKVSAAAGKLGDLSGQLTVLENTPDAKSQIDNTIVVDIGGQNGALTASIAQKLSGIVGSLPEGETPPNGASIIVIVGKN